jgi:serine/threonine protein kinase/tetratricopeptide (TPR) repeat protein
MNTSASWTRIEAALDEILALPTTEWSAAAIRLAAGDATILREIQTLLHYAGDEPSLLDRPLEFHADREPAGLEPVRAALDSGARIGAYRILNLVGRGGMGEVYRAQRADGMFEQQVALKLLQPAAATFAASLHAERQILASLEHPGIARLIDGGITADGRAYMIMEWVSGRPLIRWCEEHLPGLDVRLRLVADVCAAVAYAHQNNVAHLDLKPGNILVTGDGVVKLLDFGVARVLASDAYTQMRDAPMTPDYAAPEQLARGAISMASDVYALGLLLFEVLCGTLPWQRSGTSFAAILQANLRLPPPAPSRFAALQPNPPVAPRLLHQDLDAVVLKALKSDPRERYATAALLLRDLQAYRAGEPVSAQPDSRWYRARRFLGRHRREGLAAAAMLAVIIGAWTVSTVIARLKLHPSTATVAATPTAAAGADPQSIAVLPFLDLSEHKDQEYFSDGLSEELINRLARNPNLRVTARTSAFFFKGKSQDVAEIARQLHVANILEGSVRKSGLALRVTAQLIKADNGYQVWSQSYDRQLTDLFKVQDEIANAVVAALQVTLNATDRADSVPHAANVEALDQYLLGRYILMTQDSLDGQQRAIAALEQAVRLDPRFADAYASLGFAKCMVAADQGRSDVLAGSQALLQKAQELAPELPSTYSARSQCRLYSLDLQGALADARRAVAIRPGDVRFQNALAYALASNGRLGEAVTVASMATRLDPLNVYAWEALGEILAAKHEWPAARTALDRAVAINPASAYSSILLGRLDLLENRIDEAAEIFARSSSSLLRLQGLVLVEHARGHDSQSRAALSQLVAEYGATSPYQIAQAYGWLGDRAGALNWLEKAAVTRNPDLQELMFDPLFTALNQDSRNDARYTSLLHQLGLSN